jgi:hypothetical protein
METQPGAPSNQAEHAYQQEGPQLKELVSELKQLKLGDFKLLETIIPGTENLNPDRGNKRELWLKDEAESRKSDRLKLKNRLEIWRNLLASDSEDAATITRKAEEQQKSLEGLLNSNLLKTVLKTRELESTYRGIASFYSNAETSGLKIRNVLFIDAPMDQLNPEHGDYLGETLQYIKKTIEGSYNQFDLGGSYSLMVIPGYLGGKQAVDKWAEIAHNNKVMLVTDYINEDSLELILGNFESDKIASDEARYSNVLMASNYLIGRGKYTELGEEEDLYLNPSTSLAGKIYKNVISQASMGLQYGALEQIEGVRLNLQKTDVGDLEGVGMVPMTKAFGKVIPFSARTLYNGSNVGLKTYSVVRVFDWIMKVLMHFLNKRAGENWGSRVELNIKKEIITFLDSISGPGKVIDRYDTPKFEVDSENPSRIQLDINITPFFPAKTFVINLTGEDGLDPNTKNLRESSYKGSMTPRD